MIYVFTSAAPNYFGKVRTLFQSLREHHPEFRLHLLMTDRRDAVDAAELEFADEVTAAHEIGPGRESRWLFSHSIVELSTALKGELALHLLRRDDAEQVIYFDPDVVLFSRIDDIVDTLEQSSLVLTPHLLTPEDDLEAILDNEICSLRHGVFNLGFFGVNRCPEGYRFAEWWSNRLTHFCRDDIAEGLFTDQRWVDLAPAFFKDMAVIRDSRHNVAPWNISQREVRGNFDVGFTVDGKPLGFYHFTGFDSEAHHGMVNKYAPKNRALQALIEWYTWRTADLAPAGDTSWQLGFYDNGDEITDAHRRIYRHRIDLQDVFPDPYATAGKSYLGWLDRQGVLEYPELLNSK